MILTRREILRRTLILASASTLLPLAACIDDTGASDGDGSGLGSGDGSGEGSGDGSGDGSGELPELPAYEYDGPVGPADMFQHGVASGDPLADGVILWTHVSPGAPDALEVWWEIAIDPAFTRRVQVGVFQTDADIDHTVKLDVSDLQPGTTYYFRFFAQGVVSPVGRTRTAPIGPVSRLRFAVMSCASYGHGYFQGYRSIAARHDLDAMIHLGDYIYEYGDGQYGNVRSYDPPHEIVSLDDYRRRYRHYRKDADLREAHRQHPMIAVWDDHESADNSWENGASNHDAATEGQWSVRKEAAIQAYNEWMPIRTDIDDSGRIFRALEFGDLCKLIMLDTRLWGRAEQAAGGDTGAFDDPARALLGEDQESWLLTELTSATQRWKFIGQQVMMGQWRGPAAPGQQGPVLNPDQWDGYTQTRRRLFGTIASDAVSNVVVLTGDVHTSWGSDLAIDPYDSAAYDPETGRGAVGVEIVCPGITSPGVGAIGATFEDVFRSANPHVKFVDLENRGYVVVDLDAERVHAEWYHLENIEVPESVESLGAALEARAGTNHFVAVDGPLAPPTDVPPPAP